MPSWILQIRTALSLEYEKSQDALSTTDVGFTTLARTCYELKQMNLEKCVQSTDSTVTQLSIFCPWFQVLSLPCSMLITGDGIWHLGNGTSTHSQPEGINSPLPTEASLMWGSRNSGPIFSARRSVPSFHLSLDLIHQSAPSHMLHHPVAMEGSPSVNQIFNDILASF